MAIQINGTTVISNVPNIVNVNNANFSGIVTATKFVGPTGVPAGASVGLILTFGY